MNLKIKELKGLNYAAYSPMEKVVYLTNFETRKGLIGALLHELGHYLDHQISFGGNVKKLPMKDYDKCYNTVNNKLTRKEQKRILDFERTAWINGANLAMILQIPIGTWFEEEMADALNSYKSRFKEIAHTNKRMKKSRKNGILKRKK